MKPLLLVGLLLAAMSLAGCVTITKIVEPEQTLIPVSDRPELQKVSADELAPLTPAVREKVVSNVQKLEAWGVGQEAKIAEYNKQAKDANKKNGYPDR